MLRVPDERVGTAAQCPACAQLLHLPGYDASPPDVADRGARVWPFVSPAALVLALLVVPLPWLEVRCNSTNPGNRHYSQTGIQVLTADSTPLNGPGSDGSRSEQFAVRAVVCWLWLAAVSVALVAGCLGRTFVPALVNLICACGSITLFLGFLGVVLWQEFLFHQVILFPAPFAALICCAAATAGSVAAFATRFKQGFS